MRVAVLGGCGVLGAWVVGEIRRLGASPVVFDYRDDRSLLDLADPTAPVVVADVTDEGQLARELARAEIDRVVNVAALMPDACEADPSAAARINFVGALNVVEAAHAAKIDRVVFFSSRSALAEIGPPHIGPDFVPIPESYPTGGRGVYGITKMAAERMCSYVAQRRGMSFSCLRLASTYGPGKSARHGNLAIVSHLIEAALQGRELSIPRGGEQRNDFVYARDVGRAAAMAVLHPEEVTGPFHIGSGRLASLHEVVSEIKKHVPEARLDIGLGLDYRGSGPSSYVLMDTTRAREVFQFEPAYDVASGVSDYFELVKRTKRT